MILSYYVQWIIYQFKFHVIWDSVHQLQWSGIKIKAKNQIFQTVHKSLILVQSMQRYNRFESIKYKNHFMFILLLFYYYYNTILFQCCFYSVLMLFVILANSLFCKHCLFLLLLLMDQIINVSTKWYLHSISIQYRIKCIDCND